MWTRKLFFHWSNQSHLCWSALQTISSWTKSSNDCTGTPRIRNRRSSIWSSSACTAWPWTKEMLNVAVRSEDQSNLNRGRWTAIDQVYDDTRIPSNLQALIRIINVWHCWAEKKVLLFCSSKPGSARENRKLLFRDVRPFELSCSRYSFHELGREIETVDEQSLISLQADIVHLDETFSTRISPPCSENHRRSRCAWQMLPRTDHCSFF